MNGTLQYLIAIDYADEASLRWISRDLSQTYKFDSNTSNSDRAMFDSVHSARSVMDSLAKAKFTSGDLSQLRGDLLAKVKLLGEPCQLTQLLSMRFKTGTKLCIYKVMLNEYNTVLVKERLDEEVSFEWLDSVEDERAAA
jgi:hypothetical protein